MRPPNSPQVSVLLAASIGAIPGTVAVRPECTSKERATAPANVTETGASMKDDRSCVHDPPARATPMRNSPPPTEAGNGLPVALSA